MSVWSGTPSVCDASAWPAEEAEGAGEAARGAKAYSSNTSAKTHAVARTARASSTETTRPVLVIVKDARCDAVRETRRLCGRAYVGKGDAAEQADEVPDVERGELQDLFLARERAVRRLVVRGRLLVRYVPCPGCSATHCCGRT